MLKNKSLQKLPVLLAAIGLLGILAAGCGTNTSAPLEGDFQDRGRQLFNAKCGTCHKMAQAASTGTQGPDLDAAFAPSREVGMDDDTIKGIVRAQVIRPLPSNPNFPAISMPANIVTGNDLEDVAAYVARYAGVPGVEPPAAAGEGPGAQVFADNGCGSCHVFAAAEAAGTLGPNLDEVVPDMSRAQVEEAIIDPNATKAAGYENVDMPDAYSNLPPDQLDALIEFLMSSAGSDGQSN